MMVGGAGVAVRGPGRAALCLTPWAPLASCDRK